MRSAGEDAWLGKAAPEDPTLDGTYATCPPQLQLEHSKQLTKNDNETHTYKKHSKQLATTGMSAVRTEAYVHT